MRGMFAELASIREDEKRPPMPVARLIESPRPRAAKRTAPVVETVPAPKPLESAPIGPPLPSVPSPTGQPALVDAEVAGLPDSLFDLAEHPYAQANFLYLTSELERLDDLKLELRRTQGVAATKNAIVRCALHLLFEDYQRHKAASFVVRRLKKHQ